MIWQSCESRSTKNGQCSRADAGRIGPSALPASAAVVGSASEQQTTASYHRQRAWALPAAIKRRPTHGRDSVLAAPPPPRHGALGAADPVASNRALGAPVLSIEGARAYAPGISTGAVAVFVRLGRPLGSPARARIARAPAWRGRGRRATQRAPFWCGRSYLAVEMQSFLSKGYIYYLFRARADFLAALGSKV